MSAIYKQVNYYYYLLTLNFEQSSYLKFCGAGTKKYGAYPCTYASTLFCSIVTPNIRTIGTGPCCAPGIPAICVPGSRESSSIITQIIQLVYAEVFELVRYCSLLIMHSILAYKFLRRPLSYTLETTNHKITVVTREVIEIHLLKDKSIFCRANSRSIGSGVGGRCDFCRWTSTN